MRGLLAAPLLVALAAPGLMARPIVVRLENGTDPKLGVTGAVVELLLPDPDAERGRRLVTATVESGDSVRFELDPSLDGQKVSVIVTYKGAMYFFTGAAEIGKDEAGPFKVYETTEDPSTIRVISHDIFLFPHDNGGHLVVAERLLVMNSSDHAYIGRKAEGEDARETLRFHLPEGARNFEPEISGSFIPERIHQHGDYAIADVTIPPGQEVYVYRYNVDTGEGGSSLEKQITSGVHRLMVSLPGGAGWDLSVPGLTRSEEDDPSFGPLIVYSGTDVREGTRLDIELTRGRGGDRSSHRDGEEDESPSGLLWILGGLAFGVTAVFFAVVRPGVVPGSAAGAVREYRAFLIEELARLDADREANRISEEYHSRKRAALKKRLLELE
ncbi:MAG: hypothetical protein HY720_17125 [Planctomycetes bacterium]|nr:hypothetical protein [Planctomycetota bacterium]